MTTHFITAEIDLNASALPLQQAIDAELSKQGEPLRWAITEVNTVTQTAQIEAIVTTSQPQT
jgi:hypothetical protein